MERTWTSVGEALVEDRERVGRKLDRLVWFSADDDGLGFSPGYAIKQVVTEFRIPRVGRLALGSMSRGQALIGIEGTYKNGRARIYVVDTGVEIIPIASDFEAVAA